MDFVNETKVEAGWTLGFEPDGRELLVVAAKATFSIPENDEEALLADEQVPLTEADEFTGEPGFSAPLYETDYAHRKPYCDVLLNGSAYAPGGKPVIRVPVSLKIGNISKSFHVVGNRFWKKGLISISASHPEPFTVMPISYNKAFGGIDNSHKNPKKHLTYLMNHVGVGFHTNLATKFIERKPLPNTEELKNPVTKPNGKYRPMAFGPIGRAWQPRASFAGTYDQKWLEQRAPFWPDDFDDRYFQATPPDQQIPYPKGGEQLVLKNLTPQGITNFQLPRMPMPVLFIPHQGKDKQVNAVIDTVLLEPDKSRFMLTWRVSLPLKKNCFEIKQIVAGEMPRAWHRARRTDKPHYASIAEFIDEKKRKGDK